MKKEKKTYFSNLNLNNYNDNKKFWNTVKPLFSNKQNTLQKNITLVEKEIIMSKNNEVAEKLNRYLINETGNISDNVERIIKKFSNHPSIIDIKEMIVLDTKFSFSEVNASDIELEIRSLKTNKASTFLNISVKQLKQVIDIIVEPLTTIWNIEIVKNKTFPSALKCADPTPIFKKLECILVKNYRPVS